MAATKKTSIEIVEIENIIQYIGRVSRMSNEEISESNDKTFYSWYICFKGGKKVSFRTSNIIHRLEVQQVKEDQKNRLQVRKDGLLQDIVVIDIS